MNREQITFGVGGVTFGFVAGFVLAYAVMAPTMVNRTPSAPPAAGPVAPVESSVPTGGGAPHGDVMALLDDLKRRLEADPDSIETLLELSHLYLRAGITEHALGYLERVEALEPGNFHGMMYTTMAYEGAGREEEAVQMLHRLTERHPEQWETHYLLAVHYLTDSRDLSRARQAIARIEELNPGVPILDGLLQELDHLENHPAGDEKPKQSG